MFPAEMCVCSKFEGDMSNSFYPGSEYKMGKRKDENAGEFGEAIKTEYHRGRNVQYLMTVASVAAMADTVL